MLLLKSFKYKLFQIWKKKIYVDLLLHFGWYAIFIQILF